MSEPVEYFSAEMKNGGSFEAKTLNLLLDAVVDYYFEPFDDLVMPELVGVTLHADDKEMPFPKKAVDDLNDLVGRRMNLLLEQCKHEREHERQESMGRL